jgi:CopG family transcriptional regulator, nickel-responsive regulator
MVIVSVSINEKLLHDIDSIKNEMGFSGRSDVIRASARMLIADNREKSTMTGETDSVLTLIHSQDAEDKVSDIKHDYEDIINTQIHTHLKEHKCLEIFILDGDVQRMYQLAKTFQTTKKMDYVKLTVV